MSIKVYISGKVTGIEIEAYELFAKAEKELQAKGFETVNPMELPHEHDKSWHSYMKEDIKALCGCDAIYMLSNWTDSKGAIIEHTIAMYLGLNVQYETPVSEQLCRTFLSDGTTSSATKCRFCGKEIWEH